MFVKALARMLQRLREYLDMLGELRLSQVGLEYIDCLCEWLPFGMGFDRVLVDRLEFLFGDQAHHDGGDLLSFYYLKFI